MGSHHLPLSMHLTLGICLTLASVVSSKQVYKLDDDSDTNVLNIFAIGDWGGPHGFLNDGPPQDVYGFSIGEGMNKMAEVYELDSILLLGDNIYNEGVVNVTDERWVSTYQATFNGSNLESTPMYATSGNHEYLQNVSAMIDFTNYDPTGRWTYPDYWYNVKFLNGRVELLMLDTSILLNHTAWENYPDQRSENDMIDRRQEQNDWIEKTLSESTAEILLVSAHYPVYSASSRGSQQRLFESLDPLLVKYNVTAYFCGHDHVSQHLSSRFNNNGYTQFTQYFVVGQGTDPYGQESQYDGCENCDVEFYWQYPEDCLGVFGMLNIYEDETGLLKPIFRFIDARDNTLIYQTRLHARFAPEIAPTPKPTPEPSSTGMIRVYTAILLLFL